MVSAAKPGTGNPGEGGTVACSEPMMTLDLPLKPFWREVGVEGAGTTGG